MESNEQEPKGETPSVDLSRTSSMSSTSSTASSGLTSRLQERAEKSRKILDACKWKDLQAIGDLAASEGGLISDEVRRVAWPVLLGCSTDCNGEEYKIDWRELRKHRDEEQVALDVHRSFIYYPNGLSPEEIKTKKEELSDLIIEVLRRNPYLCYFQGYHDICQVFLLVLSPHDRVHAVARLSVLRIRDFMLPTLSPALAQLRLIPLIIKAVNPRLYTHLSETQPYFALPGTLTMYAHDIEDYSDIARLFDVLLARPTAFSLYIFAQIVLERSAELFETPSDEPDMLHAILSKLPRPLDLDSLISNTIDLFEKHPPEGILNYRVISRKSVLITGRNPERIIDSHLCDGEELFKEHIADLDRMARNERRLEVLWKYRRPAKAVGIAVLVGLLSYALQRQTFVPKISDCRRMLWEFLIGGRS